MTSHRLFAGTLLAATALTFAAPASAQQIDRIVTFGDSYADTGILRAAILADPLADGSPPSLVQPQGGIKYILTNFYSTGRFSGGTNYIDTLAAILDVPVENYAVGGALATGFPVPFGSGTSFNTNCGPGGINGGSPASCPLGFTYQVDQFLNVGTQSPLFPTGTATFDEGDLVTVSIGGNDARYYQRSYSALPMQPFIDASIAGAMAGLDRLVAAGAPTISFLAGDTSRLPEVIGNSAAQAIRSAYSTAFNTGMQGTLSGYAADGVMVHYLDLNLVTDNILADPAAYGITQGSAASLFTCPAPTSTVPGCLADSSGYLFYFDGLHLTSGGFAIIAQYVATQLNAPLVLQAPGDLGLDTARQFGRTLGSRVDLGSPRDGDMPEGLGVYLVGDTLTRRVDASDTNLRFKSTTTGATAGVEYGFGSGMVGIAANISRPRASFTTDAANVDGRSVQLGVYGGAGIAGGFVQGYAGYGWDDNDLDRDGVVENMNAKVDGNHRLAGIKAGYLMPMGSVRVGPVVGLDYAKATVDAYTEDGDAALTLDVGKQSYSSLRGSIGAEVRGDFAGGGIQLRPFAAVAIEKELKGDGRTLRFAQTSAPTIVNRWRIEDSKKAYGRISAGFSAAILDGVSLNVTGSGTVGEDAGHETSAHVGLRAAF